MKVEELIKELKTLNPKAHVVLATDEEGNGFHRLNEVGVERFEDAMSYSPELDEEGETAVVLWP